MKKGSFFCALFIGILPVNVFANMRPLVSIAAGADYLRLVTNQNVVITSPYYNTYYGNNRFLDFAGGVFAGFEGLLSQSVLGQIGLSYYQNTSYRDSGYINQFGDPALNNLRYQFDIVSKRFFVESKILAALDSVYHPFLNIGLGASINYAGQYTETPVSSADVPMVPGFQNRITRSFAYLVGAGVDMDITKDIRLGALYRFVSLGGARLNTTPLSDTGQLLKSNNLRVNEIFIQFTYLG